MRPPKPTISLPKEILVQFFRLLKTLEILQCRLVSVQFNEIICSTSELQYIIELERLGYENGVSSILPSANRLHALRKVQEMWRNPELQRTRKNFQIPNRIEGSRSYEQMVDGVLLFHSVFPSGDQYCTRVVMVDMDRAVQGRHLHSTTLTFDLESLDSFPFRDQNLLVLVEYQPDVPEINMHFKSILDGKPHPRAKKDIVTIPLSDCPDPGCSIHVKGVYGDLLQFCAMPSNERIHDFSAVHLIHWPSGRPLKVWSKSHGISYKDGLLANEDLILLSGFYNDQNPSQPFVEVHSISLSPCYSPNISLLSTFFLPRVHDPTSGPTISTPYDVAVAKLSQYDFRSSRNALVHLTLSDHNFFIPLTAFLTRRGQGAASEPRVHQWADWGPQSTRMVCHYLSNLVICGYRVVLPNQIWDFNPALTHSNTETSTCSPTGRGIFMDAVETRLPYTLVKIDPSISPTWTSFMTLIEYASGPKILRVDLDQEGIVDVISL